MEGVTNQGFDKSRKMRGKICQRGGERKKKKTSVQRTEAVVSRNFNNFYPRAYIVQLNLVNLNPTHCDRN